MNNRPRVKQLTFGLFYCLKDEEKSGSWRIAGQGLYLVHAR